MSWVIDTGLDQRPRVLLTHRRVRGDDLIDLRLRERRLIALVVAVLAIAHEVDQVIELEALAVGDRQARRLDARDRIVGVDVRDRNLESAREAARVAGAEGLFGIGRETELVVGDDVNDAADVVAVQPREIQRLGDDALAGERRIAVNQDREHFALVDDRRARRLRRGGGGASHAVQHRIHRLEVARVRRHRDDHLLGQALGPRFDARAGVVLDVAHPAEIDAQAVGQDRILELREDLRVRLLQDVREHVQAAAMRHRDHHVLHAAFGGVVHDLVEDRDHHVEALDRKARLAGERPMQKPLERFDLRDARQQLVAVDRVVGRAELPRFDRVPQPHALVRYEHVVVIVAGGRTVNLPEPGDCIKGVRGAGGCRPRHDRRRQLLSASVVRPCDCGASDGSPIGS